jgi:hypothetical protein
MQDLNLFTLYTEILNKHNIPYFVTGSVASIVYGDPRLTHDIDLVITLKDPEVSPFLKAFPLDEFYCPPEEVIRTEVNRSARGHFNLIHHETGFKADVYLTGKEDLQLWAMRNINKIYFAGCEINIAPPEYVIIKKLEFYKEGNAQKHLLDIKSITTMSPEMIDYNFLKKEISERGLEQEWDAALKI